MKWTRYLVAGLVTAVLAGCPDPDTDPDIELYAFTSAPVGRTATVRNQYDPPVNDIELTAGVAVGVSCWDSCDYTCVDPTVSSDDESIVRVKQVYRSGVSATQFVLIAVAPGDAHVNVRTTCAERRYPVHVGSD